MLKKIRSVYLLGWLLAGQGNAQSPDVMGQANALGGEIVSFQPEAEAFIATWTATGLACAEASGLPFGNLRQPCRKVRAALRDGEFLLFAGRCAELGERHHALVDRYRVVATQPLPEHDAVEAALLDNERRLIAVCSVSTWNAEHPVFAGLRAQASDPRYRTPANRFFAHNPDYRLRGALENTVGAGAPGTARDAPVTGAGSFVTGSDSP